MLLLILPIAVLVVLVFLMLQILPLRASCMIVKDVGRVETGCGNRLDLCEREGSMDEHEQMRLPAHTTRRAKQRQCNLNLGRISPECQRAVLAEIFPKLQCSHFDHNHV